MKHRKYRNNKLNTKKNILITGASAGIGAALASQYASATTRLILIARSQQRLDQVAKTCEKLGSEVICKSLDISNASAVQKTITELDRDYPIDLIICNAGTTNSIGKNGEAETWDDICRIIDTNLYGVLASLNPLISRMQQRQQGQIGIVSSLGAYRGMPITPSYCASKAAVKSYGEALRGWLDEDNIKVSVICPGFVESELSAQFHGDKPMMMSPDKAAQLIIKGLNKNTPNISFPFPLNLGMWFLAVLPAGISNWLMKQFSYGATRK